MDGTFERHIFENTFIVLQWHNFGEGLQTLKKKIQVSIHTKDILRPFFIFLVNLSRKIAFKFY